VRIVVVGAGLGGMAAAVGLNRSGHEVTVCERAGRLRETGTGILIAPNGVRALDGLGLGAYARKHVLRTASGGLRDWRGRPLLVADMGAVQEMVGAVAMVSRPDLLQALRAPLPDGLVHTGMPVERLEQDDTGVWVTSGGRRVRADMAVVADGISSVLRSQLFAAHPGLRRTGRLDLRGMLPAPDGLTVDGLLASNLVDRRTGSEFGLYPVGAACLARPLPSFAVGRVALLGDAAHAMPPDLGQGASQAFEDAAALARHLDRADPPDVPERLRRYDAQRRPPANRLLRQAQRMSRLTAQTGARGWLRDVALRAVPSRLAARQAASAYGMTKRDPQPGPRG
jgi:2-polyprenyl-6-methoxyphenol hydroxylase-like FAD-dependent oxidoreductase